MSPANISPFNTQSVVNMRGVFAGCEKLKEVHLKKVEFMGDQAFGNCGDGITPVTIYYHGTKEQWDTQITKNRYWHKWTDVKIKFVK